MSVGAVAIRNDGTFASPVRAKEGLYVIAQSNTIESICSDDGGVFFQKLWLYPYNAVASGVLTPNSANIALGKSTASPPAAEVTKLIARATIVTATVTAHALEAGMMVNISGATDVAYNGNFRIRNVTPNSFEYLAASAPTDQVQDGGGLIYAQRVQFLPDILTPTDINGMSYALPEGQKMRLTDVIIYGTAGDGVFYCFT